MPNWREVNSFQFGTKPETIATKMTSVQFVQKLFFISDELAEISLSDNSSGSILLLQLVLQDTTRIFANKISGDFVALLETTVISLVSVWR